MKFQTLYKRNTQAVLPQLFAAPACKCGPFHKKFISKYNAKPETHVNIHRSCRASCNRPVSVCVSAATRLKSEDGSVPEGKVKIRLEHDGTILDVDEDDVEKVGHVGSVLIPAI